MVMTMVPAVMVSSLALVTVRQHEARRIASNIARLPTLLSATLYSTSSQPSSFAVSFASVHASTRKSIGPN
jgi:hypothetical protein